MKTLLFHTKNVWVRYDYKNTELILRFPNEPLPHNQTMGIWEWGTVLSSDYCVTGRLISKSSLLKILRILKNHFGINTKIKVYSESEYETIIFHRNMKDIEKCLTADEKYAAVNFLLEWLPGENIAKHFDNVLGNAAVQMGKYGDAEYYAEGFTQYWVKPYVDYVLSFR